MKEGLRGRGEGDAAEAPGSDGAYRRGGLPHVLVFGVFVIPILLYAAMPMFAALTVPPGGKSPSRPRS